MNHLDQALDHKGFSHQHSVRYRVTNKEVNSLIAIDSQNAICIIERVTRR